MSRSDEPSPRTRHFSAPVEDKLYVWGGDGGHRKSVVTSIVHHYDPDSETWNTNTCEGPHPPGIEHGACASAGHHLYTYGGWDEGGNYQGTLHLLDTRSRRWKLISSASEGGSMKKTGSRMIVYDSKIVLFGGFVNSRRTNELHTFNLRKVKDSTRGCHSHRLYSSARDWGQTLSQQSKHKTGWRSTVKAFKTLVKVNGQELICCQEVPPINTSLWLYDYT